MKIFNPFLIEQWRLSIFFHIGRQFRTPFHRLDINQLRSMFPMFEFIKYLLIDWIFLLNFPLFSLIFFHWTMNYQIVEHSFFFIGPKHLFKWNRYIYQSKLVKGANRFISHLEVEFKRIGPSYISSFPHSANFDFPSLSTGQYKVWNGICLYCELKELKHKPEP